MELDKTTDAEKRHAENYRVLRDFGYLPKPETFYIGQKVIHLAGDVEREGTLFLRSGLIYAFNDTHVSILAEDGTVWSAKNYRVALY